MIIKLCIIFLVCLMFIREPFASKLGAFKLEGKKYNYIIPINEQNKKYEKSFRLILNKMINNVPIGNNWNAITNNTPDHSYLKKYTVSLISNILRHNTYGLNCVGCLLATEYFRIVNVFKNNHNNDFVVDFLISIKIQTIPYIFTVKNKCLIKSNTIPIFLESKLIGIAAGDTMFNHKYRDYDNGEALSKDPKIVVLSRQKKILDKRNKHKKPILEKKTGKFIYNNKPICFDSEGNNKMVCESELGLDGKPKKKGVWDKPCINDEDCPFFIEGNKGGCLDGLCRMPRGVKRLGSRKYVKTPDFMPKCNNCIGKTKNCCYNQIDKDIYKKQDFIFD